MGHFLALLFSKSSKLYITKGRINSIPLIVVSFLWAVFGPISIQAFSASIYSYCGGAVFGPIWKICINAYYA